MPSRRGFVSSLFALPVALVITRDAATEAEFRHGQWTVYWGGWRQMPTQFVEVGVWAAFIDVPHSKDGWISTTLGKTHRYRELEQFDCALTKDGTIVNPRTPPAVREQAKRDALARLLEQL